MKKIGTQWLFTVFIAGTSICANAWGANASLEFAKKCDNLRKQYDQKFVGQPPEEWTSWAPPTCGQCAEPWGQIRCDGTASSGNKIAYRVKWGNEYYEPGEYYCGYFNFDTNKDSGWRSIGPSWSFKNEQEIESAYQKCFTNLSKL